jgi:hypothetical protein
METHVVYCSACDRNVEVLSQGDPPSPDTAGPEVDPSGICIDYSTAACTGSMCALFDLPPAEMLVKLQQSGREPKD